MTHRHCLRKIFNGFCDKWDKMVGVCSILIGRNLPNLWLVNSHRRGAPSVNRVGSRIRSSTAPKHSDPRPRFGSGVDSHLGPVRKPRAGAAGENRFASTDGSRHAPAPWKTHSTAKLRSAMETFKDYYRTLRVRPTADDVTIKAAFRRLALKYHPDVARNPRGGVRGPGGS